MLHTSWYLPGVNVTLNVFVKPTSYSPDSPTLVALGSSSLNLPSAPIGIPPSGRSVRMTSNSWLIVPLLVTVNVMCPALIVLWSAWIFHSRSVAVTVLGLLDALLLLVPHPATSALAAA